MDQTEVRRLFVYERRGMLRRRNLTGRQKSFYPWRTIGRDRRYLAYTHSDGVTYYLHRLIWLYHKGVMPFMIDHRKTELPLNNRIGNLRECTNAQNQYNGPRRSHNKSGFKGVVYREGYRRPWQARITVGGKPLLIGRYNTPEEAAKAYTRAAKKHAGQFAWKG